ncbi:MAG: hypothetical protein LC737_08450, partial [Chloroflexi bacterium]|nr:hypothetical protein [Chloroflexota bacterium]
ATPLARLVTEQPTPVHAPNCFASPLAPSATKDFVTSIAVADTDRVFTSVYSPTTARTNIYVSDDGMAWTSTFVANDFVGKVVPSPVFGKDHTVFAVGAAGMYRSLNNGSNWTLITPGAWFTSTTLTRQFAISPNFANDHLVLLGSRAVPRGVFASSDGGTTWSDWLVDAVDALLFSPAYAVDRAVWAARNDEQTFRRDVLLTTNDGETWETVHSGNAMPLALSPAFAQDSTIIWSDPFAGLFFSRNSDKLFPTIEKASADVLKIYRFGEQTGWTTVGEQPITSLAFSPTFVSDRTAFATSEAALLVTRSGGARWTPSCYWGFDAQRLDVLRMTQLAVTPNESSPPVLYAGGAGSRLALSRDGGQSWSVVVLK